MCVVKRTDMPNMTSIHALEQAAMIIDTDCPAIRAANEQARRLWGLDAIVDMPIVLDPAMPALAGLQTAGKGSDTSAQNPADQVAVDTMTSLVFWTSAGAQSLRCLMQPLADPGRVLVIFDDGSECATDTTASMVSTAATRDGAVSPHHAQNGINMHAMAHELRTPIGAIIALAEMIETEQFGPIGDPRYREYARDIGDSARLSLGIVAGALEQDAAKGGNLLNGFAELNVAELINKSLRTVRQTAIEAGVNLKQDIARDLPNLIANAPGLTQILLNLLTNAIKFTPEDGTVTVTAAMTPDACLSISVRDTGVGMTGIDASVLIAEPQSEASSPIDPPPSDNPRRGIGFSLVRRLASAMTAKFDVASTRGVGTRVTLTFPPTKVIPVATVPARV